MFGLVKESGQGVAAGIYQAEFIGAEAVPANQELGYKPAFKFSFKVKEGEFAGTIASRIPSGEIPTTKNGLGKFLAELTQIPLAAGVDYGKEINSRIGKLYQIVVKQGPKGGTRVDTVIPVR